MTALDMRTCLVRMRACYQFEAALRRQMIRPRGERHNILYLDFDGGVADAKALV